MNDHEEKEYKYTALAIKTVEDTTSYDQVQVNVGSLSFPFKTESLSIYGMVWLLSFHISRYICIWNHRSFVVVKEIISNVLLFTIKIRWQ